MWEGERHRIEAARAAKRQLEADLAVGGSTNRILIDLANQAKETNLLLRRLIELQFPGAELPPPAP